MNKPPIAFMSYVHFDDKHENGRLSEFRERLSGEVQIQSGEEFPIFQDRNDILWGQNWQERIEESLDAATFLIPILTPSFLKSAFCRKEVERFLEREKQLGRQDLILPVYYVSCPLLDDPAKRAKDPLAEILAARQYTDWREFRFDPLTSPQVGKTLAALAAQVVAAVERTAPAPKKPKLSRRRKALAAPAPGESSVAAMGERSGPTRHTEPPTLVVDALHRGDHATIGAALKDATPGSRILVRPGLYPEGLVIDKPVEILGDGPREEIVIQADGQDVILFQTSMGRVANLTLRQMGGGNWYGVDIAQGRLELDDCDITSRSLACVAIHGGADPRLRRNRIHDGKASGVFVYDNGLGTLEDNDIFANVYAGVSVKTGGNPLLRRNRIHDGKASGVYVQDNGQGTLEDNEIFANANAGVVVTGGGNPVLRRNRIHKNGYEAVWIYEDGGGHFEGNDLRGNGLGAWDIAKDCLELVTCSDNHEE